MASEGTKQGDLVQSPEEFIDKPKKGIMDLSPEVRGMVYKHLLKGTGRVTLIPTHERSLGATKPCAPMARINIHTGILYSNKAINREATEFLYGENTFAFEGLSWGPGDQNWRRVFVWLNKIGPANRSHLRELQIEQESLKGFERLENGSRVNRIVHYRNLNAYAVLNPYPVYEERSYTLPATKGAVKISPYVKKVFDLFSEDHWSKLKITMDIVSRLVPGPC